MSRSTVGRGKFEKSAARLAPIEIVLEACGSSHHWGRFLQQLGHRVRPIPSQYVKPFVKRSKNDRNDAEAICEAASRSAMRSVPVKSAQTQAAAMDPSARDLLVRQRPQLVNAVRGHAAEFGVITTKGIPQIKPLLTKIAEADMPEAAKMTPAHLGRCLEQLDVQLADIDRRLAAHHKANPLSQRLAMVPGVGPITALSLALKIEPIRRNPSGPAVIRAPRRRPDT